MRQPRLVILGREYAGSHYITPDATIFKASQFILNRPPLASDSSHHSDIQLTVVSSYGAAFITKFRQFFFHESRINPIGAPTVAPFCDPFECVPVLAAQQHRRSRL